MNSGEYIFSFVRLDKFVELFRLADKKRQEPKQTYCIDKQKINTTKINDDYITTERPAANTRLCPLAADVHLAGFAPATNFGGGAAAKTPASRPCP